MASIEESTATLTSPPLISYAVSEVSSRVSSSSLTSIHEPAAAFNFDSSLSAEKRVRRAPRRRTQNSASSSRVCDWSTAKTLQLVPSASKWWDSTARLGGLGRFHQLHAAGMTGRSND